MLSQPAWRGPGPADGRCVVSVTDRRARGREEARTRWRVSRVPSVRPQQRLGVFLKPPHFCPSFPHPEGPSGSTSAGVVPKFSSSSLLRKMPHFLEICLLL